MDDRDEWRERESVCERERDRVGKYVVTARLDDDIDDDGVIIYTVFIPLLYTACS